VFNVAQTEGVEAEAARAPVAKPTPAPQAPTRQAKASRAPESKKVIPSGAPSAPAVTTRPHVVVSNPTAARMPRSTIKRAGDVAPMGTPAPLADTAESAAEIIRLNKLLNLTEAEARALVRTFPTRRYFEPDELAAAAPSPAREADAARWLGLWQAKAATHRKIGALKTWAWLVFTGRDDEAAKYRQRSNARKPV
jgi:hypothetical protein